MTQVQSAIALGANLGDASATLKLALELMAAHPLMDLRKVSRFISSAPVGGPSGQPSFFNAVAEIRTSASPYELLQALSQVENELGRVRAETWAARSLDLDILFYAGEVTFSPKLILPHPRMTVRRFVMELLAELLPGWVHPQLGWTAERIAQHITHGPRCIDFGEALRSIQNHHQAATLLNHFEELTSGWRWATGSEPIMFEVHGLPMVKENGKWLLPRFYPTADDPETLIKQAIATCRGLTDSVFTV